MATKKYMSLERLTEYDGLIKGKIDSGDATTLSSAKSYTDAEVSKIKGGTVIVKEAEHADSADEATHAGSADHAGTADSATKATQDGDGKVIASTYETKTDASAKLTEAKTYTDTVAAGKSDSNHNHDDEYYTESEIDTKIDTINAEFENIRTNVVPSLEQEILDHANDNYLHVDFSSKLKWDTHIETPHAPSDAEANQDAFGSIVVGIEGDDYKHIAYARSESDSFGIIGGDLITFLLGTDKHEDENVNYETLTISVDSDKLDARYDAKGAASTALDEAKAYTDTMTSGIASTAVVDNKISAHNTSTSAHTDIRDLISELSTKVNNFLDVDDTTTDQLSEVLTLINNNKGTLESLTSNKVNVSDIADNLTTSSTTKVLSAKQGVALKALIDALQTAVDGKADEGHGHAIADVTNLQSTLDAKAAQSSLDSHTSNTTVHITATERTNWNAAKTHADSAHAPSNAQANVIESIKVNGTAQTVTSKAVNITVPTKASDVGAAEASHTHAISEITDLQKTLNNAATGIQTNTNSINAHTDRLNALEGKVEDGFTEITSTEIQNLFK